MTAPELRSLRRIVGARVPGHEGLVDIDISAGRVEAIVPSRPVVAGTDALLAEGRVVSQAFVDAHVHLDKAYVTLDGPRPTTLEAAIAAMERHRSALPIEHMEAGARRGLESLVGNGVVAARVHVEISPGTAAAVVDFHLGLADPDVCCSLELVAFPQLGLDSPSTRRRMDDALRRGLTVVGGCPYVDRDPLGHLDFVFELAERYGCPIDLHLDFGDDPGASLISAVVERTVAAGMIGQVAVGHVTTLAGMSVSDQQRSLDLLASAGIALVVLPTTDLFLGGHGEPGTRSLAPIERAVGAGVTVAVANNNLANPFSPFGNGSLLQAAWLAGITRRVTSSDLLLDSITTAPAAILGLAPFGPSVGSVADLVLLDTVVCEHLVHQCPPVVATVHNGKLVHDARHRIVDAVAAGS